MEDREDSIITYKRIIEVWGHGNEWYANIVYKTLQELYNRGYVPPKAYILNYYENTSKYSSDVIVLEEDALTNPIKNEACYEYLRMMAKRMENTLVGFMFVTEGTFTSGETGEKSSFLLFTFENGVSGRRDVYRCVKQTVINERGPTTKIIECFHDRIASVKNKIAIIEKYNHIVRPNYMEKLPEIYN